MGIDIIQPRHSLFGLLRRSSFRQFPRYWPQTPRRDVRANSDPARWPRAMQRSKTVTRHQYRGFSLCGPFFEPAGDPGGHAALIALKDGKLWSIRVEHRATPFIQETVLHGHAET
jgi:hypothetical protein